MHCPLLAGVAVLCLTLPHLVHLQPLPSNILKTECRKPVFWIWIDQTFFGSDRWQLEAFNETGSQFVMKEPQASQCGYTISQDLYGNVEIRISFLGCSVFNTNDQQFKISVQFRVFRSGGRIGQHPLVMTCLTSKIEWDTREILCEENYMEVSVTRIIPIVILKSLNLVEPVIGISQEWKVFFSNGTLGTVTARQAINRGYGVNVTVTRVVFRAPYHTAESIIEKVNNYSLDVIYSNMAFRTTLLALFVDTTLACPNDPPVFTNSTLSWFSPAILRPLVTGDYFTNSIVTMGVSGKLLKANQVRNAGYTLRNDSTTVEVTVPIGADGGYLESDIIDNHYVTTYRIHLMLERQWLGINQDDSTTHTQFKPIVTPLIKQVPVFLNHTIIKDDYLEEKNYFNVSLGNFYLDVVLHSFTINKVSLPLPSLPPRNMAIEYVINQNNTQAFYLTVPFKDYVVVKTPLDDHRTRYTLYVTYIMTLVPKQKNFTYTGIVEAILKDVPPPPPSGYCTNHSLVIEMPRGRHGQYWIPYIRNLQLTDDLIKSQKFLVSSTDDFFRLEVPYPSLGLVYEEITLEHFRVRLDLTLRDNTTLKIKASFSQTCVFPPPLPPLVCFPDGTIIYVVNSSNTKPPIDARRTHLRDPKCEPVEAFEDRALFTFSAYTCNTTHKFEGDFMYLENEVIYDRRVLLPNQPIISRDSTYRVTLRCRYPIRETLWLGGNALPTFSPGLAIPQGSRVLRRRARTPMADLRIATDAAYTTFFHSEDFPVSINSVEGLNIQVDVPSGTLVLLQECWATAFSGNDQPSRLDLVIDGCAAAGKTFSAVTETHDNFAQLKVTFNGAFDRQLHVHCQVSVCDARFPADNCQQNCNQSVERTMGKKAVLSSEMVSAGPVHVFPQHGEVGYRHLAEEESWSTWGWALAIGLAVIAAFTVGAIFLAVRLFVR